MSVTTATQRLTAAHHETQRDKTEKARETGNPQLTGRFRRWWLVLGSNQRRLSRRFYSCAHRGWSRSREIFGTRGWAAGGGYPACGTAFAVRAGLRMRFYGGGLPVTPAGLWDLSPFYSLAPGPDL